MPSEIWGEDENNLYIIPHVTITCNYICLKSIENNSSVHDQTFNSSKKSYSGAPAHSMSEAPYLRIFGNPSILKILVVT